MPGNQTKPSIPQSVDNFTVQMPLNLSGEITSLCLQLPACVYTPNMSYYTWTMLSHLPSHPTIFYRYEDDAQQSFLFVFMDDNKIAQPSMLYKVHLELRDHT
jgi:hypothetical protein